jgi:hypothetical protein
VRGNGDFHGPGPQRIAGSAGVELCGNRGSQLAIAPQMDGEGRGHS